MYCPAPVRRRYSSAARIADRDEARRHVVGVGAERPGRGPVGPAAEVGEPGDGGGEIAVAGERRPGARLSHETGAEHHDVGLDGAERRRSRAPSGASRRARTTPSPRRPSAPDRARRRDPRGASDRGSACACRRSCCGTGRSARRRACRHGRVPACAPCRSGGSTRPARRWRRSRPGRAWRTARR